MNPIRKITAGVAIVAAAGFGGAAAHAATPTTGSEPKPDVIQGQADQVDAQAGTNEPTDSLTSSTDAADTQVDNAATDDDQGDNEEAGDQAGDQVETSGQASANDTGTQDSAPDPTSDPGN